MHFIVHNILIILFFFTVYVFDAPKYMIKILILNIDISNCFHLHFFRAQLPATNWSREVLFRISNVSIPCSPRNLEQRTRNQYRKKLPSFINNTSREKRKNKYRAKLNKNKHLNLEDKYIKFAIVSVWCASDVSNVIAGWLKLLKIFKTSTKIHTEQCA